MSRHYGAVCLIVFLAVFFFPGQTATQNAAQPQAQNPALNQPTLSSEDKAEVAEALRLKTETGDQIWPGLAGADIPIVLFNAGYEFLVGETNASKPWEAVPEDDFQGKPYYRRPARDPQSFAVKIGNRWAGSVGTLDLMLSKIPIKLGRDFHTVLLLHEMFHAFQAAQAPKRFDRALAVYKAEGRYPFKDKEFAAAWTEEGAALAQALKAAADTQALSLAGKFLDIRRTRRSRAGLSPDLVAYERELEWLEGLAKRAEIRFYEIAGARTDRTSSIKFTAALPFLLQWDFARLEYQLGAQEGDLRFYLSGMAQARLLDRLSPGWKSNTALDTVYLEDILAAVISPQSD